MSNFSENLKRLRANKGMTQKDLADRLSVVMGKDPPYGVPAVSAWEARGVLPPVAVIKGLCEVLECSMGDFLGEDAVVHPSTSPSVINLARDFPRLHGCPVYMVFTNGQYPDQWGLINADNHSVRILNGLQLNILTFGDNVVVYDNRVDF